MLDEYFLTNFENRGILNVPKIFPIFRISNKNNLKVPELSITKGAEVIRYFLFTLEGTSSLDFINSLKRFNL